MQWGYLSDRFGRRPLLILGPLGLTFSMFSFGTSTTFITLVVSRFFQGVFNGSIGEYIIYFYLRETLYLFVRKGVSQSMIAEVCLNSYQLLLQCFKFSSQDD